MTAAGPRNPSRTRQFYEGKMGEELGPQQSVANSTTTTTTPSQVAPPPPQPSPTIVARSSEPSTAIPAARPPLEAILEKKPPPLSPPTKSAAQPPLIGVWNNMWDGVRGMLGINRPTCVNGGKPGTDGKCHCPKYFEGASCERKVCLNGGTLKKVTAGQVSFECVCPHPLYIEGVHCETIRCANQAPLIREANNSWSCDCTQRLFHKGVFCEKFSPPIGIAIPLAIVLIFLLCCGLCRIDWCPRKQPERRRSDGRRNGCREQQQRRRQQGRSTERARGSQQQRPNNPAQEFLLPGERALCSRNPVAFPAHGNPYIIRLDTIPTFNPNMIGGVEAGPTTTKPMEPPPPYEQAIQAPPAPDPPRYTERPVPPETLGQPPPPSRHPPQPPPNS